MAQMRFERIANLASDMRGERPKVLQSLRCKDNLMAHSGQIIARLRLLSQRLPGVPCVPNACISGGGPTPLWTLPRSTGPPSAACSSWADRGQSSSEQARHLHAPCHQPVECRGQTRPPTIRLGCPQPRLSRSSRSRGRPPLHRLIESDRCRASRARMHARQGAGCASDRWLLGSRRFHHQLQPRHRETESSRLTCHRLAPCLGRRRYACQEDLLLLHDPR